MNSLNGPRLKLSRAKKHLNALETRINEFIARKPYTFEFEPNPTPPDYILVARQQLTRPDDEWSVIIGDFAHNARSVLDHIIYRLSAIDPNDTRRFRLQFPICDCARSYKDFIKGHIFGISSEYLTIIEGFQPYHRIDRFDNDPLGMLRSINDTDKHRILHFVSFVTSCPDISLSNRISGPASLRFGASGMGSSFKAGDEFSCEWIQSGDITKDGTIVAKIMWKSTFDMNVNPEGIITIKFDEGSERVKGRPVMDTLTTIYDRVEEVIGKFEGAFPK